jgi:hypothetical protein
MREPLTSCVGPWNACGRRSLGTRPSRRTPLPQRGTWMRIAAEREALDLRAALASGIPLGVAGASRRYGERKTPLHIYIRESGATSQRIVLIW